MDTEETFDLIFYRPIGYCWALLAKRFGITPNVITIASIFLGIGAAVCFYYSNFWINLAGCILLMWADSFDSADGQLARMTHQYSRIGRILDGLSGDIWFVAIYASLCLREMHTSTFFMQYPWLIWVIAAVTGLFHGIQAAMADYYRQFHLYFVKGKDGSELESATHLRRKYEEMTWSHDFIQKLVMRFYLNYTVSQERRTPNMQAFRRLLKERYGNDIPADVRHDFRMASKPLMKFTNILSFNTRTFALFAALLIFSMPWLYFAFELTVLNIILIYMIVRHERICRFFRTQLSNS